MYWTLELAQYLEDAPWPATKDELIDYADRTGAPGPDGSADAGVDFVLAHDHGLGAEAFDDGADMGADAG